jgi:hypothetical protein
MSIRLLYVPSIMQRSLIGYSSLHNTLVVYVQDITNQLKCIMLIKILKPLLHVSTVCGHPQVIYNWGNI